MDHMKGSHNSISLLHLWLRIVFVNKKKGVMTICFTLHHFQRSLKLNTLHEMLETKFDGCSSEHKIKTAPNPKRDDSMSCHKMNQHKEEKVWEFKFEAYCSYGGCRILMNSNIWWDPAKTNIGFSECLRRNKNKIISRKSQRDTLYRFANFLFCFVVWAVQKQRDLLSFISLTKFSQLRILLYVAEIRIKMSLPFLYRAITFVHSLKWCFELEGYWSPF